MRNGQLSNEEVEVSRKGNQQKLRESVSASGSFFPETFLTFSMSHQDLSPGGEDCPFKQIGLSGRTLIITVTQKDAKGNAAILIAPRTISQRIIKGWLNDEDSVL